MNRTPNPRQITAAEQHDLEYIRDLTRELAAIARAGELQFVEYLLEMTCQEATGLLGGDRLLSTAPALLN